MKKIIFGILLFLITANTLFAGNSFRNDFRGQNDITAPISASAQRRFDYVGRTDGQPVYIGSALPGKASSADAWFLQKLTYDGSDQVTLIQVAYNTWDNRATATYS